MNEFWTADDNKKTKQLKALIEVEGLSFAKAAKVLGCTRHSAIGRAYREKIGAPKARDTPRPIKRPAVPRLSAAARAERAKEALARRQAIFVVANLPALPARDPGGNLYTALTIKDGLCRWPIGDPQEKSTFHFCGNPSINHFPYCLAHSRKAINPEAVKFDVTRQMRSVRR